MKRIICLINNTLKYTVIYPAFLFYSSTIFAALNDFSRYQIILDRKPFGQPPPVPAAGTPQIPVPPSFIKDLKMVAMTREERGGEIKVGIINESMKPPKSFFLRIGESEDGIKLVQADYEMQAALLQKDVEEQWLYMEGAPQAGAPQVRKSSPAPAPSPNTEAESKMSYAEKLRLRREALQHRQVEPPKMAPEELEKHLRDYNLEAIRKGLPALPIQLTPEEDAQLVKEGVLPP